MSCCHPEPFSSCCGRCAAGSSSSGDRGGSMCAHKCVLLASPSLKQWQAGRCRSLRSPTTSSTLAPCCELLGPVYAVAGGTLENCWRQQHCWCVCVRSCGALQPAKQQHDERQLRWQQQRRSRRKYVCPGCSAAWQHISALC